MELKDYYFVRVNKALIKPETFLGVDITGFVLNTLLGLFFCFVCKIWYLSFLFITIHFILRSLCKKDGAIITIFLKKYLKQSKIYYKG